MSKRGGGKRIEVTFDEDAKEYTATIEPAGRPLNPRTDIFEYATEASSGKFPDDAHGLLQLSTAVLAELMGERVAYSHHNRIRFNSGFVVWIENAHVPSNGDHSEELDFLGVKTGPLQLPEEPEGPDNDRFPPDGTGAGLWGRHASASHRSSPLAIDVDRYCNHD